ncbi:hypothetical protein QQS21_009913 [Conoideocrella luteorostrata]|uniref:Beta-lactamase-related domain-containing protein n=1 Tax=Conoideocrella luteorostrata TaxID=1105319 RepID=A0AAJ0FUP0_9HYPO|nr:hypothetical protein QQS21_009913 [Conoideocrella luteorostrata]
MTFDRLERIILTNSPSPSAAQSLAILGTPSTSIAVLANNTCSSICYSTLKDNTSTLFQACSISKAVAGMAIMRLIDQGLFTLQSTILQLLPAETLAILTEDSPHSQRKIIENITVKQLMSHTAGLSVGGFGGYPLLDKVPPGNDILRGQFPINNLRVRLQLLPGLAFSYSGGGTTVLQIILETLTGKPFSQLMKETILEPLHMSRSFYGALPPDEKNAAYCHETGYTPSSVPHHIQPELAAAGLWTTPTDLIKVVQAIQRSLAKDDYLRQSTAREMLTAQKDNVGLSWFLSPAETNFSHTGSNNPGFRCMFAGFAGLCDRPAPEGCGLVVMTNSAVGSAIVWKISQAICYLNGWPAAAAATAASSNVAETPFWDGHADVGDGWKAYRGQWTDGEHTFMVDGEEGYPTVLYDGLGPIRLLPAARPGARNEDGACCFVLEGLKLLFNLKEENGKKILAMENGAERTSTDLRLSGEEKI